MAQHFTKERKKKLWLYRGGSLKAVKLPFVFTHASDNKNVFR
jgi:methionine salvage enolase-phosphatase E1